MNTIAALLMPLLLVSPLQPESEGATLHLSGIVQAVSPNGHDSMRSAIGPPPIRLPLSSAFNIFQKPSILIYQSLMILPRLYLILFSRKAEQAEVVSGLL